MLAAGWYSKPNYNIRQIWREQKEERLRIVAAAGHVELRVKYRLDD